VRSPQDNGRFPSFKSLSATLFVGLASLSQVSRTSPLSESETIVYSVQGGAGRNASISSLPVTTSFTKFVDFEKAIVSGDPRVREAMEKRGDLFWVESGTRCRLVGGVSGTLVGTLVRQAYKIGLLNGDHEGKTGWIAAEDIRKRSRIVVDLPESITEENRETPHSFALAYLNQDKVIYREIVAAQDKASAAALMFPPGKQRSRGRYRTFRREFEAVLDRYDLDEVTAFRILDWGKKGGWPSQGPKDEAKAAR
jgi:hypothetical protein